MVLSGIKSKGMGMNKPLSIRWVEVIMGVCFALMWSSAFTSARIIVQNAPPLTISSLRFFIAGFIAVSIAFYLGQSFNLTLRQWRATTIFGVCQNALYLGLFFVGMQWIEASLATVLASVLPLLVGMCDHFIFKKKLRPLGVFGLIIGFTGVCLILEDRISNNVDIRGLTACFIGVCALTFATLSVREASSGGNIIMVIGIQMLIGGFVLAVTSLMFEEWKIDWSVKLILAFSYTLIIPGLIATWVWFKLVDKIGPTQASSFHFLNPVFGVIIAAVILNEELSMLDYVGVFIIAIGILAVQVSKPN